jgi:16S rRNA (cytidine1402-2'-O)-methyltransferase
MPKLYMLPVSIAEKAGHTIPAYAQELMRSIPVFVMERGKTGRQLLKDAVPDIKLQEKTFIEMGDAPHRDAFSEVMQHLGSGRDVAVVTESGCPGVADPGAIFADGAHQYGIQVVPIVGPSSILLALMASGMNGQQFAFVGYVTNKKEEMQAEITELEERSRTLNQTQIFIETPYRNRAMLDALIKILHPNTRLCLAYDLTSANELIISQSVWHWRRQPMPTLEKRPAIFLVLA